VSFTDVEYEQLLRNGPRTRQATPGGAIGRSGKGQGYDPFLLLLEAAGLPRPAREHRFHPGRRWRFDYAWPPELVALEVEGGAWTTGRHTRGQGFIDDMAKYNQAALLGWKVLRFTPDQLAAGDALPVLRVLFRETP
jgi:hypothetical protein